MSDMKAERLNDRTALFKIDHTLFVGIFRKQRSLGFQLLNILIQFLEFHFGHILILVFLANIFRNF